MKLGMNHPMGPLALADLIGLDVCLAILEVLHEGLGDDKYRPARCCGRWWRRDIWRRAEKDSMTRERKRKPVSRVVSRRLIPLTAHAHRSP